MPDVVKWSETDSEKQLLQLPSSSELTLCWTDTPGSLSPPQVFLPCLFFSKFLQTHQVSRFTSLHWFVTNLWSSCIEIARKSSSIQNWRRGWGHIWWRKRTRLLMPIFLCHFLCISFIFFILAHLCCIKVVRIIFVSPSSSLLLVVCLCRQKEGEGRDAFLCELWHSMKVLATCLEKSWSQTLRNFSDRP